MGNGYLMLAGGIIVGVGTLINLVFTLVNRRRHVNTERYMNTPTPHSTPECKLCKGPIQFDSKTLQCGHSFHDSCIKPILENVTESCKLCPYCCTRISD